MKISTKYMLFGALIVAPLVVVGITVVKNEHINAPVSNSAKTVNRWCDPWC